MCRKGFWTVILAITVGAWTGIAMPVPASLSAAPGSFCAQEDGGGSDRGGGGGRDPSSTLALDGIVGEPFFALHPLTGLPVATWSRRAAPDQPAQAAFALFDESSGAWSVPLPLTSGPADHLAPEVAFNDLGDAFFVWRTVKGSSSRVETARRLNGGSLEAPVQVSDPGVYALEPHVTVLGDTTITSYKQVRLKAPEVEVSLTLEQPNYLLNPNGGSSIDNTRVLVLVPDPQEVATAGPDFDSVKHGLTVNNGSLLLTYVCRDRRRVCGTTLDVNQQLAPPRCLSYTDEAQIPSLLCSLEQELTGQAGDADDDDGDDDGEGGSDD